MTTTVAATLIAMLAPLAAMPAQSLRLEIDVPPRVTAGEPVPITLRATNHGDALLELYLMGRSVTFDVSVADSGGKVVWRRLEGEVVPAILQVRILAPGDSLELEHVWNQQSKDGQAVDPGSYTVTGTILTDGRPLTTPTAPLRIMPRERKEE
ncbi:MAG: BsuPI-related putative proteinase inhibitor [Gemmatimonadota bacterium]|nr:BsuPI-related putative proteinase inhibitor [Gemmatimonadota bacterium]